MGTLVTVGLTTYVTLTYVVGWGFWMAPGPSWGGGLAFAFSPVTVPLGIAVLCTVYQT